MQPTPSVSGDVKLMRAEAAKKMRAARMQHRQETDPMRTCDGPMSVSADTSDVMAAIKTLREDLHLLVRVVAPEITFDETAAAPHAPHRILGSEQRATEEEYRRRFSELSRLKTELRIFSADIERTKREIATLRPSQMDDGRLIPMTSRPEAIVNATDHATRAILKAAEKIDTLAGQIKAGAGDARPAQLADEISEAVVSIFESCHLQTITDQRISQVVHRLQCVEEHVARSAALAEEHDGDRKFPTRSQGGRRRISQGEIDQLFN